MSELEQATSQMWSLIHNIETVIHGKEDKISSIVATLVAGGNILLEDVPGVGKTLLCRTIAKSLSADFKRVQCTPDILPTDITGVNIFDAKTQEFRFLPGPVFTNIFLADEINRAAPKTQSALLEAMEERQVSVDNQTYTLPELFFVLATKNPLSDPGTYPMPLAQLDRFWIRLRLGYPEIESEIQVVQEGLQLQTQLSKIKPIADAEAVLRWRQLSTQVHVADDLTRHVIQRVTQTRHNQTYLTGISPRAVIQLLRIARVYALLRERDYVTIEDVQALSSEVFSHRLILSTGTDDEFIW